MALPSRYEERNLRPSPTLLYQRPDAIFLDRAERYRAFDGDPSIRVRTAFFSAAQSVTMVLAFAPVSPFISTLSLQLESLNRERAERVRMGALFCGRSLLRNTADFIRFEQGYVQQALDHLRARSLVDYIAEVEAMNRNTRRAAYWPSRLLSHAHDVMYRALRASYAKLGRTPDFRDPRDRETLGLQVAVAGRSRLGAGDSLRR